MRHKIKSIVKTGLLILALFLGFSLLKSISTIVGSNQKIIDANKKVLELEKEQKELNKKLSEVKSIQFIEQEARDKLSLAKKGELVVVLPDRDTLKSLAPHLPENKATLPDPNWKKWMKLFF